MAVCKAQLSCMLTFPLFRVKSLIPQPQIVPNSRWQAYIRSEMVRVSTTIVSTTNVRVVSTSVTVMVGGWVGMRVSVAGTVLGSLATLSKTKGDWLSTGTYIASGVAVATMEVDLRQVSPAKRPGLAPVGPEQAEQVIYHTCRARNNKTLPSRDNERNSCRFGNEWTGAALRSQPKTKGGL